MVSYVRSASFYGIEAKEILVEVDIIPGVPSFHIIGLPDKAVGESRERIKSTFFGMGLSLPPQKVLVNLAPANLLKEGSHFDLAIALGVMIKIGILPYEEICEFIAIGELSLSGDINSVNGTLPAAILANANNLGLICPKSNYSEAFWSGNQKIVAPEKICDLVNLFKDGKQVPIPNAPSPGEVDNFSDLYDVKGQKIAKRALEIAAAGGHNMLMVGPPGSGKSMLAKRMIGILPPLTTNELLEVNTIYSVAGQAKPNSIITKRPFREPHSSSSMAAMVGGGKNAKPGEITLAHNGVLFMDELPEYNSNVLESLRQPLEGGEITIARVNSHVMYPANFQLIAAMNPCKCGYFGDLSQSCTRAPRCVRDYQSKISGPLMDRFDLQIEIQPFNPFDDNASDARGEKSAVIAERVLNARILQNKRYGNSDSFKAMKLNKHLDGELLSENVVLCDKSRDTLKRASEKFRFSMRGINRILRVARTIADLEGVKNVNYQHILEAISYRAMKYHA